MTIGSTNLSIGSLLCVSLVLFTSQTLAARNPRFHLLNEKVYHTLKCYRSAKGFPGIASPKGALAKAIGLAPVHVDSWNKKNVTMRYSLCISTLDGFRKAMDTLMKTEKNSTPSCSQSPNSIKLTDSLKNLSIELHNTVDALHYLHAKLPSQGTPLQGVKTFDAGMALRIAHKTVKIWPPKTKGRPRQKNPQSLVNLVILQQLWGTTRDFTRYNICPVPFLR